jgi:hypothetical protein
MTAVRMTSLSWNFQKLKKAIIYKLTRKYTLACVFHKAVFPDLKEPSGLCSYKTNDTAAVMR